LLADPVVIWLLVIIGVCFLKAIIREFRKENSSLVQSYSVAVLTTDEEADKEKLWAKLKRCARVAGLKVVYAVLLLYFTLQNPKVPIKAKAIIIGALGYFVAPLDVIIDAAPLAGYTDDLATLMAALGAVAMYIDKSTKIKAQAKLKEWYGRNSELAAVEARLG